MTNDSRPFWRRLFGGRDQRERGGEDVGAADAMDASAVRVPEGKGSKPDGTSSSKAPRQRPARPEVLTTLNMNEFLRKNPRVVVDVWAPWCVPCRQLSPVVEYLAGEMSPDVRFGKINADHEKSLSRKWEIRSIPTLLFFRDGELVRRQTGVMSAADLRRKIQRTLHP